LLAVVKGLRMIIEFALHAGLLDKKMIVRIVIGNNKENRFRWLLHGHEAEGV
jgi:hypothetical protein